MGQRIIRVSGQLLRDLLQLPATCQIVDVHRGDFFQAGDEFCLKVESPDFKAVPEGCAISYVAPIYEQHTAAKKFTGWSGLHPGECTTTYKTHLGLPPPAPTFDLLMEERKRQSERLFPEKANPDEQWDRLMGPLPSKPVSTLDARIAESAEPMIWPLPSAPVEVKDAGSTQALLFSPTKRYVRQCYNGVEESDTPEGPFTPVIPKMLPVGQVAQVQKTDDDVLLWPVQPPVSTFDARIVPDAGVSKDLDREADKVDHTLWRVTPDERALEAANLRNLNKAFEKCLSAKTSPVEILDIVKAMTPNEREQLVKMVKDGRVENPPVPRGREFI